MRPSKANRNSSPYSDGTSFISYPEVILSLPIRRVKRQYRPIHTDCSNSAIGAWRASAGPHKAGFQGRSRAARGGAERQPLTVRRGPARLAASAMAVRRPAALDLTYRDG